MKTAALLYHPVGSGMENDVRSRDAVIAIPRVERLAVLFVGSLNLPLHDIAGGLTRPLRRLVAGDLASACDGAADDTPDLILMEASLVDADGLKKLSAASNGCPVIAVCRRGEETRTAELLGAGAAGVVPASLSGAAITAVIQLVLAGQRFAPADVLLKESADPAEGPDKALAGLSSRESEVARMIALGLPNKEIACRLGLQEITIKVYASSVFRKLGVRNRTAAAARLIASGV